MIIKNIFIKPNAPYLIPGALATSTLLASGVLAAAPYIGFLAPIAALNVGLPFIIGCALFSVVIMAFSSYRMFQNSVDATKEQDETAKEDEDDNKEQGETITDVVQNSVNATNEIEPIEESKTDNQNQVGPVEDQPETTEEVETNNQEQVEIDNKEHDQTIEEPKNQEQVEIDNEEQDETITNMIQNSVNATKKQGETTKHELSYAELVVTVSCILFVGYNLICRATESIGGLDAGFTMIYDVTASAVNSTINSVGWV